MNKRTITIKSNTNIIIFENLKTNYSINELNEKLESFKNEQNDNNKDEYYLDTNELLSLFFEAEKSNITLTDYYFINLCNETITLKENESNTYFNIDNDYFYNAFISLNNEIDETLENLLSKVYNDNNVKDGSISPLQKLKLDSLVNDINELFNELISQNL
jgi:hypothetical protein